MLAVDILWQNEGTALRRYYIQYVYYNTYLIFTYIVGFFQTLYKNGFWTPQRYQTGALSLTDRYLEERIIERNPCRWRISFGYYFFQTTIIIITFEENSSTYYVCSCIFTTIRIYNILFIGVGRVVQSINIQLNPLRTKGIRWSIKKKQFRFILSSDFYASYWTTFLYFIINHRKLTRCDEYIIILSTYI